MLFNARNIQAFVLICLDSIKVRYLKKDRGGWGTAQACLIYNLGAVCMIPTGDYLLVLVKKIIYELQRQSIITYLYKLCNLSAHWFPWFPFHFHCRKKWKKDQKESKKKRMKRHKTTEIHTRMRFFFKCEVKILSLPKNTNSVLNYSQSCSSTRHVFIFRR